MRIDQTEKELIEHVVFIELRMKRYADLVAEAHRCRRFIHTHQGLHPFASCHDLGCANERERDVGRLIFAFLVRTKRGFCMEACQLPAIGVAPHLDRQRSDRAWGPTRAFKGSARITPAVGVLDLACKEDQARARSEYRRARFDHPLDRACP